MFREQRRYRLCKADSVCAWVRLIASVFCKTGVRLIELIRAELGGANQADRHHPRGVDADDGDGVHPHGP